MLEERSVKKEATILCVEMSNFCVLDDQYCLQFEKSREAPQNRSLGSHDREVNIEIHVIGISTCSIIIENFMNVEKRQRLT